MRGKYECTKCDSNKNLQDAWGCEGKAKVYLPTFEYIENNIHYKLCSCPIKFIPDSVHKFFMIYKYHTEEFPTAPMPAIRNISLRFLLAMRAFNKYRAEYELLLNKDKGI
jgi:hypothetical protein